MRAVADSGTLLMDDDDDDDDDDEDEQSAEKGQVSEPSHQLG